VRSCGEAALTEKRVAPTARAATHVVSARTNFSFIIAVSGRLLSGHIVPKDRCAESVLQHPSLSYRDFQRFHHGRIRHKSNHVRGSYISFAYSAWACFRMGMSGSASFQRVRKERLLRLRYCGSPTFCTNSANLGSERMGSNWNSVFKPSRNVSRS
jgi:hypothetical protein